ncbi:MAG: hypothetical protein AB8E82_08125 [Aureispira sp.]
MNTFTLRIWLIIITPLFFLTACDTAVSNDPTFTQTVHTKEQEIHYTSTYTVPADSSKWTVDSVYNEAVQGLTHYQYHYTQSNTTLLQSYAYQRSWSANNAVIPNYNHQYTSIWSIDSTINYKDGQPTLSASSTIQATILSPQKLTYADLAPAFQRIYNQLRLQINFHTPRLPDYTPIDDKNMPLVRFKLRPISTDGEKTNYGNFNFLEEDAVWLPQQQVALPLDLNVKSSTISKTTTFLVFQDSFPEIQPDNAQ